MVRESGLCGKLMVAAVLITSLGIAGCRSAHIETTIQNRTGAPIQLLEVEYPSASFGADSLADGQDYHYRIKIRGTGALKVQYTDASGHQAKITGPTLKEDQQGQLIITLVQGGKAEFHPELIQGP
jgi:hypothetical protein